MERCSRNKLITITIIIMNDDEDDDETHDGDQKMN